MFCVKWRQRSFLRVDLLSYIAFPICLQMAMANIFISVQTEPTDYYTGLLWNFNSDSNQRVLQFQCFNLSKHSDVIL